MIQIPPHLALIAEAHQSHWHGECACRCIRKWLEKNGTATMSTIDAD